MHTAFKFVLPCLVLLVPLHVRAQTDPTKPQDVLKTKELLSLCSSDRAEQRECLQYIKGVRSGVFAQKLFSVLYIGQKRVDPPNEIKAAFLRPLICVPDGEADEHVRDRVIAHIKGLSPEHLEGSAGFAVMIALGTVYPYKPPQ